jgi:hypothetical protein
MFAVSSPLFFAYRCIDHHYFPSDFKNPNDPHDRSFDPHPTDYPIGELEFPNSGATERYVFYFVGPVRPWRLAIPFRLFLVGVSTHFLTQSPCVSVFLRRKNAYPNP